MVEMQREQVKEFPTPAFPLLILSSLGNYEMISGRQIVQIGEKRRQLPAAECARSIERRCRKGHLHLFSGQPPTRQLFFTLIVRTSPLPLTYCAQVYHRGWGMSNLYKWIEWVLEQGKALFQFL